MSSRVRSESSAVQVAAVNAPVVMLLQPHAGRRKRKRIKSCLRQHHCCHGAPSSPALLILSISAKPNANTPYPHVAGAASNISPVHFFYGKSPPADFQCHVSCSPNSLKGVTQGLYGGLLQGLLRWILGV